MLDGRLLCWMGMQWRLGTHRTDGPRLGRWQGRELQLLRPQRGKAGGAVPLRGVRGDTLLPLPA